MICPACKSLMLVVEHDGIELDHCPRCAGTWFDRDELGLLLDDATGALGAEAIAALPPCETSEKPRRCPACRRRMRKANIGPASRVLIDVCPAGHGIWFDGGELADLADDLRLGGGALAFVAGVIRRAPAATETEDR